MDITELVSARESAMWPVLNKERLLPLLRPLLEAALVTVIVFFVLLTFGEKTYVSTQGRGFWHTADDHMITQRVAQNIWAHGQPYYNVGERVAANTSLFWPFVLSLAYHIVDLRAVVPLTMVASALCYAVTVVLTGYGVGQFRLRMLVTAVLSLAPTALAYAVSAWEHVPQTLFFTVGSLLILRAGRSGQADVPVSALALYALAFMMRPDTAIALLVPGAVWLLQTVAARRFAELLWLPLLLVIPIAYLALMSAFYGSFWPNTAYLKLNPGAEALLSGLSYVLNPYTGGIAPYLIVMLALLMTRLQSAERVIVASMGSFLGSVVVVGGDFFPGGRFFMFLLPAAVLISVRLIERSADRHRLTLSLAFALAALLFSAPTLINAAVRERVLFSNTPNDAEALSDQIRLAAIINTTLRPEDGSIGLRWLGIGYHLPTFHIVDFLGKAEPHIARLEPVPGFSIGHNKFDFAYAFSTYNIAAFPNEDFACRQAAASLQEREPRPGTQLAVLACREALVRGNYRFLSPAELGLHGEMGLVVRNDLVSRFRQR